MPKKSLGQNFLINKNILSSIVENGKISNEDIILEIGPGTGNLTEIILKKKPKHLIVVEKDKDLSVLLKKKFNDKIEIINDDILNFYTKINYNSPLKVFGNLPYNISTKILTSFIKTNNLSRKFNKFIFVFQKEVAERILSKENTSDYGRLSILTSWKMRSSKIMDIDPKFFFPKPKVWSTALILTPKLNIENLERSKSLEHITNIFFNQRRKMIRKPLKQLFDNYEDIAKKLNLDLKSRPQNISKDKYLKICKIYEDLTF